jgi:hypothetical protein
VRAGSPAAVSGRLAGPLAAALAGQDFAELATAGGLSTVCQEPLQAQATGRPAPSAARPRASVARGPGTDQREISRDGPVDELTVGRDPDTSTSVDHRAQVGPVGVGPGRLAEPFDVEGEDPSSYRDAAHPSS